MSTTALNRRGLASNCWAFGFLRGNSQREVHAMVLGIVVAYVAFVVGLLFYHG